MVFQSKPCSHCHLPSGREGVGPALEELRRPQGAYELTGRFWNHAPAMFTVLRQERLEWPTFTETEMNDLMAYLRADAERDPAPNLFRGNVALVKKGCLKCHAFRGEGGRTAPDLARHRESFENPARWAITVWRHAPHMAGTAVKQEVLYPRFTGEEMTDLVGYLRKWK